MLGHDGGDAVVLECSGINFERALPPGEEGLAIVFTGGGGEAVEMLLHQPGERHAPATGDGFGAMDGLGADRKGELGLHTWKQGSYVGGVKWRGASVQEAAFDEDGEFTGGENEVSFAEHRLLTARACDAMGAEDRDEAQLGGAVA